MGLTHGRTDRICQFEGNLNEKIKNKI